MLGFCSMLFRYFARVFPSFFSRFPGVLFMFKAFSMVHSRAF